VIVGSFLINSNLFVDQVVASTLPTGQVSTLNYALKLMSLPILMFSAFAKATLTSFSEQVSRRDWSGLCNSIRLYTWLMLAITIIMTVGAMLFARPAIGMVFQRGNFGAQDTTAVSAVFKAAALGLVPMGLGFLIPRVFNAMQRNGILTAITVFSVSANVVLDLALAPRYGAVGIALATSIVMAVTAAVQLVALSRMLGGFNALGAPAQIRTRWRSVWSQSWRPGPSSGS